MNTKILVNRFGPILSNQSEGLEIYTEIKTCLDNSNNIVEIDLSGVISMATFCAKQIFGQLFIEYGSVVFNNRIIISNASGDLKSIIRLGIRNAIDTKN